MSPYTIICILVPLVTAEFPDIVDYEFVAKQGNRLVRKALALNRRLGVPADYFIPVLHSAFDSAYRIIAIEPELTGLLSGNYVYSAFPLEKLRKSLLPPIVSVRALIERLQTEFDIRDQKTIFPFLPAALNILMEMRRNSRNLVTIMRIIRQKLKPTRSLAKLIDKYNPLLDREIRIQEKLVNCIFALKYAAPSLIPKAR